jgi:hypothetical protein
MTTRKTFYFVAGEQVMTFASISVLDAWMKLERHAEKQPVACEYRELLIDACDETGNVLESHNWNGWHEALLRDTYGENWREHMDHAGSLA